MLLYILLCLEVVLRTLVEIRERRLTQLRGGVFAVLRLVPLVNDIVPLPENRSEVHESKFVKLHEEGHKVLHHAVLRNLMKIAFWMVAVWFMAAMMVRWNASFIEAVLWLHLAAIPFRMPHAVSFLLLEPGIRMRQVCARKDGQESGKGRIARTCCMRNSIHRLVCARVS